MLYLLSLFHHGVHIRWEDWSWDKMSITLHCFQVTLIHTNSSIDNHIFRNSMTFHALEAIKLHLNALILCKYNLFFRYCTMHMSTTLLDGLET
jgi:hypothetical protein